jgi:hypothetical protein
MTNLLGEYLQARQVTSWAVNPVTSIPIAANSIDRLRPGPSKLR